MFRRQRWNKTGGTSASLLLCQLLSGQHLIALEVFVNGFLNYILGKSPVISGIRLEPVAGELFIKGRLSMSRLISVSRPEAGAVRCEHLVAQNDGSVLVETEFKLGISDNDSAA